MLLDRDKLDLIRTVEPEKPGAAPGPMLVVEDKARRVFYVGNFNGGLGRIPINGDTPKTLDLGTMLIGMAISPDGRWLAVNGARDLTLRLVDLESWKLLSSVRFGNPDDPPLHSYMTHGLASTHPVWLPDGSGVLTEDNIHEAVVLIGRDGKEKARRRLRSATHTFLMTTTGHALALAEGIVDGSEPPRVVVLELPSLKMVREIVVPLAPDEPAKLHHGSFSSDGEIAVVANMGPMHGEKFGTTVAALRWRTGELLWRVPTVRNAGHVRFLDKDRIVVLGHRDPELAVLDVQTGKRLETWKVSGTNSLGHSLGEEARGTVLVIDSTAGRLVRLGSDGIKNQSPHLGQEVSEASLPE
ncbi:MAG: WD40 repeat domain-containing protein [Planctomycetia bacterium]|nr:WD40 repeat domain-containing protein [Planctomycetia bacterium]